MSRKREPYYFILELPTSLVDGWYFKNRDSEKDMLEHMEKVRKSWDKQRPQHSHVVCKAYFPDDAEVFRFYEDLLDVKRKEEIEDEIA